MKHELRVMLAQGNGSIVNVSSTFGHTGAAGASIYSASEHAVEGLTKSAALEAAASGVRVNMVAPGPIDTDLNPAAGEWAVPQKAATALDRYGRVDEIAAMVAFVAGPESSYITGANLTVDGGMNA
jgi:3-oxoacyl-[acyl-carrier protein] reductase